MDETACFIVNSRGILKSCDVRNPNPSSSSDYLDPTVYKNIKDGQSVYLCTESIDHFFTDYFPFVTCRVVIVSGDSDLTFSKEYMKYIVEPRVLHWYAQNCNFKHPKVTHLPIGLDYHTVARDDHPWSFKKTPVEQEKELQLFAAIEPNRLRRDQRAYGNFLLNIYRGNRQQAFDQLDQNHVVYEREFIPRAFTWWKMAACAFVISPHGNGIDCHRTWESLALGSIPVVVQSELDPVYGDLPVLRLESWKELTKERAKAFLEGLDKKKIDWSRLTLAYWTSKIKGSCKIE